MYEIWDLNPGVKYRYRGIGVSGTFLGISIDIGNGCKEFGYRLAVSGTLDPSIGIGIVYRKIN